MMHDVNLAQAVITLLVGLAIQTLSLIGMTYLYVWLYNRTQSVFLTVIFHALSNTFSFWLASFLGQSPAVTFVIAR